MTNDSERHFQQVLSSMDSNLQSWSPDKGEIKPSFRRPLNDAANRKYRRRSPDGSASSSSGTPRHGQSASPIFSREDMPKTSDDRRRRKGDGRQLDRDAGWSRRGKGGYSHRDSDRQSHGSSHDYRRHDEHSRSRKYSTEGDTDHQRSSRSGRETSDSSRFDHSRNEGEYDRSRDYWRHGDKYSRDKPEDVRYRSKDKERQTTDLEHQKYSSKDSSSDRAVSGRRHTSSNMEEIKTGDRDKLDRARGGRDDKKDYRSSRNHKNDRTSFHEEPRGYEKYSSTARDSGANVKETQWSNVKELDGKKDVATKKRNPDDGESEKHEEQYHGEPEGLLENDYRHSSGFRERDGRHEQVKDKASRLHEDQESSPKKQKFSNSVSKSMASGLDERPSSSLKQVQEAFEKMNQEHAHSSAGEAEATNDLNAAKVAAMKAAELVNRNLIGTGYMSTDQKKKLLWGNKKNTSNEELLLSGHRWDLPLFSDRERQEKFNKLMGVKGDLKLEQKPENQDGSGLLQAEKQKELEQDLEKHFTAGLRRRDGRTVGLGL
ncbi:hypothetical protein NE237_002726 [Protea cynaroides]|uniref:Small acidic protein-like domain-containing protein n=1 Tax=Protea cynaroides TaxID=273540 RepID=A0A9Q0QRW6_9MAGN|nr:hypothetical protein NE237_002726 [Protea cynaroides]